MRLVHARVIAAVLAFAALPALAQPIAPPPVSRPSPESVERQNGIQPRIYVFRGFADVFSIGMNDLALKLFALGYQPVVESHVRWQEVADTAVADYRADPAHVRIAIIGHSLGANAAIAMAAYLGVQSVPVAFLATFDPTFTGLGVSRNVRRAVNFYSGGTLGFPLQSRPGLTVENVDRTDLGHVQVAKAPELHERTIAELRAALAQ